MLSHDQRERGHSCWNYFWKTHPCKIPDGKVQLLKKISLKTWPRLILMRQVNLPTAMLIFLSQIVNRFTEEFLDMVIQVNLTVMLVLATLWAIFVKSEEKNFENLNVSVSWESASPSQALLTSSWLRCGCSSPWSIPLLRFWLFVFKICSRPGLLWNKVWQFFEIDYWSKELCKN